MSRKCGRIFNRHDWFYAHRTHRICLKCGKVQETLDSSQGSFWSTKPFDPWLDSLESMIKWDSRYDGSEEKALEWVKNHISLKGEEVTTCPSCKEKMDENHKYVPLQPCPLCGYQSLR